MNKKITISAPGKLILLGEHVVVYGKPAIISSVAKRCYITLTPRSDSKIEIISKNLNASTELSETEIIKKSEKANQDWLTFTQTNDIHLLKSLTLAPLDYAALIIGETLIFTKKNIPSGFTLSINSEIPIGPGMGSSAAMAVSIAAAVLVFLNEKFDKEIINQIAFLAEQKRHGFPSGGDNSASCFGGFIWFRKETPDLKIISQIPFSIDPSIAGKFQTIFTGTPEESTGELVGFVRNLYQDRQKFVQNIFDVQETLVREFLTALKNGEENEIIRLIRQGEKNLESLGVVSPLAKSLIQKIEKAGGAAKICGAGGIKNAAGTILAFHKDKKVLADLLQSQKFPFSQVSLGTEGVRLEE